MTVWYDDDRQVTLYCGDCREVMPELSGITAVVTDPPYGLKFMGKEWDHGIPGEGFWTAIALACLPGAPLMSFGGTRTFHRLTCAIEDAGWWIRDCLMWLYGTGFPKSHDVSKAIAKGVGYWRGKAGKVLSENGSMSAPNYERTEKGVPVTEADKLWNGYGTALKPAWEPIILAMKPLDGTFAYNAVTHGVAGLNVDGGRVGTEFLPEQKAGQAQLGTFARSDMITPARVGRWPANVIHDGGTGLGSASRFFYCAKASKAERNCGCEDLPGKSYNMNRPHDSDPKMVPCINNNHPTVKPLALMRYLLTLVTYPERNIVLDPFMGSGSTGIVCVELGLPFIGIEKDEESFEIAKRRILASSNPNLQPR